MKKKWVFNSVVNVEKKGMLNFHGINIKEVRNMAQGEFAKK